MFNSAKKTEEEAALSLRESLSFFRQTAKDYWSARSELLALEAREAALVLRRKLTLAFCFLLISVFAYMLFWSLVIGGSAVILRGKLGIISDWNAEWLLTGLLVLALHAVMGLLLLLNLKQGQADLFAMSKRELQKDKEWLEDQA